MTRYDFPPRPPEAMLPVSPDEERAPRVAAYIDASGAVHSWDAPDDAPRRAALSADWSDFAARQLAALRRLRLGTALLAVVGASLYAGDALAQVALLNVSYDPTRELYREFNEAFNAHWQARATPRSTSRPRTAARARRRAPSSTGSRRRW